MSSFYDYGCYICEAWKKGRGTRFCSDYIRLLNIQLKDFHKNPELVEVITCFLEENDFEWEGVMKELSDRLKDFLDLVDMNDCIKIPSTPNRLSREIGNLKAEFEKSGISVKMSKTKNNSRYIRLCLEEAD